MKTKYVFVLCDEEELFRPVTLERCCIFDNFEDAKYFYKEKGYALKLYSNDTVLHDGTKFYVSWAAIGNECATWHGSIYKGWYY